MEVSHADTLSTVDICWCNGGGGVRLQQILLYFETTVQNDHRKREIKYLSETDLSITELHLYYEFQINHWFKIT